MNGTKKNGLSELLAYPCVCVCSASAGNHVTNQSINQSINQTYSFSPHVVMLPLITNS